MSEDAPDDHSLPGETLLEVLEDRGMTQAELAARMGRPTSAVRAIIRGEKAITRDAADQLERILGVPASFWNNLERNDREFLARTASTRRHPTPS